MLHPTVRLIIWGVLATLVQRLPLSGLSLACASALAAGTWFSSQRLGVLLMRTRWLIVSLIVIFALATPGVYLLPALGGLGPTEEGVRQGIEHLMRLLFVLATLAVLLQMTGVEGLVAGLHGLILPLAWIGLDRGRVAMRLLLVLQYVEQSPPSRHWREWLEGADAGQETRQVSLRRIRLSSIDYAVLTGLTLAVLVFNRVAS